MYVVEFFSEAIFPRKVHDRCLASLKYTSAIYLKKDSTMCFRTALDDCSSNILALHCVQTACMFVEVYVKTYFCNKVVLIDSYITGKSRTIKLF